MESFIIRILRIKTSIPLVFEPHNLNTKIDFRGHRNWIFSIQFIGIHSTTKIPLIMYSEYNVNTFRRLILYSSLVRDHWEIENSSILLFLLCWLSWSQVEHNEGDAMSECAKSGQDAHWQAHLSVCMYYSTCGLRITACVQIPGLTWYDYVKTLAIFGCISVYRWVGFHHTDKGTHFS